MKPLNKQITETGVMLDGVLNCDQSFFDRLDSLEKDSYTMVEKMWKLKRLTNFFIAFAIAIGVGETYRAVGTWDISTMLSGMPTHAGVYLMVGVILIIFNQMIVGSSFKRAHHGVNMATSIRIEANLMDDQARQRITAYLKKVRKYNSQIEKVLAQAKYVQPVIVKTPMEQIIEQSTDHRANIAFMDAQVKLHRNLLERLSANPQYPEAITLSSVLCLIGVSVISDSDFALTDYIFLAFILLVAIGYLGINLLSLVRIKESINTVLQPDITPEQTKRISNLVYTAQPYTFINVGAHMGMAFVLVACVMGNYVSPFDQLVLNIVVYALALIGGLSLARTVYLCARRADAYKRIQAKKKA